MSFTTLDLPPDVLRAVASLEFAAPQPIQIQAIPVLLAQKSAMLVSRTGSGKTLAYLLPILARINPQNPAVQAVILAPTHELALQITRVGQSLSQASGLPWRIVSLIGGAASSRQIEALKKKPQIVVGSLGRMNHLLDLGKLKLRDTSWLVFDEADRLLMAENWEQVQRLTSALSAKTNFVFVSATQNSSTTRLAQKLAPDLELIRVKEERISPAIRHYYLVCEERDKIEWLRKAVHSLKPERALIFVHRGVSAAHLAERLAYHQLTVADLHGARDKIERQRALEQFRLGKVQILLASDLAARGLDISGVDLVVNLDAPRQSNDYLHRAGRTGRAGAPGTVLTFISTTETKLPDRYAQELAIITEEIHLSRGQLVAATKSQKQRPAPSFRAKNKKHPS